MSSKNQFICSILLLFLLLMFLPQCDQVEEYDLVILNGKVMDGTGNPWFHADVAVRGDRIVAIGQLEGVQARETIDASGLYVTPGFVDVHSHAGGGLTTDELSQARPQLAQGVTTVIINPDGNGALDLQQQKIDLLEHGLGINTAQFVPHGTIRREVIGQDDRAPTADELEEMKRYVREAMEYGAVGLSTGLFYAPASFAETDEIVELAAVAAQYNGIHQSHIRDESDYTIGVQAAVEEIIEISRQSGIAGAVTHIKALGPNVWGQSEEITRSIDEARDTEGIELYADQYPYEASATGLSAALVPRWATDGGRSAFLERLEDDQVRRQISEEMWENLARRGGADRIMFRRYEADESIEGTTLQDVADDMNLDAIETALYLLENGVPRIVSFNMHDDDIENFMTRDWLMTSSDGGLVPMGQGVPHPRNYGAFSRKIKTYVYEENIVTLPFAIRGMTSLPATAYRLPDRGLLQPGKAADILVFDPKAVRDNATFTDPHQLSEGMTHVIVNGVFAIRNEEFTGEMPGRILLRGEL